MRRQRNFARPHRLNALNELNVTPMLDLCFCLLIIFMIATPVLEQTTQLDLPLASKHIATPPPPTKLTTRIVALDRYGQLSLDGKITTESGLQDQLKIIAAMPEADRPPIRVRIDGHLPGQRLFDLFDLVKKSGLSKVSIDTEVKDS